MMTEQRTTTAARADETILEVLQERMERIIQGDSPNAGRFCGYCYARLEAEQERCPVCGRATDDVTPVPRVPRDALRVYNAYRKKMRFWVNLFAFAGILLAVVIFLVMITYLPNPWIWFALAVLLFAPWYFANLLVGWFGAALGARQGTVVRAAAWRRLLERRAAGENLDS